MVKDNEKKVPETTKEVTVGLVRLTGETGVGMSLPDGSVVDLTNVDMGTAQMFEYIVKSLEDLKRSIA